MMATMLTPSRLHSADVARTAGVGLRTRKLRAALSALGIMIGIAAMVGVLGLSESSKSDLLAQLDKLGTNLLTVQAGGGIGLGSGQLPAEAAEMVARIGPVEQTTTVSEVDANVYKNDLVPLGQTGGITVQAVDLNLMDTLAGSLDDGVFLNEASAAYPTTVLGSVAAERLGIAEVTGTQLVWLGDQWFTVVGVLDQFDLNPDLDRAALVGMVAAETYLDHDNVPTSVLVRADPDFVDDVMNVLAATANPENPEEVEVARPTDALEAREAADDAFTALFLGLGGVALLVGGVGIANVMVISVLERRSEIGLRRALGATKRHVAVQFLGEALLLAAIGGVGGVLLGYGVTTGYASLRGWSTLVPPIAIAGGIAAALLIGAIAGLYPAVRAARMSPTEALRSS
ncbi:MAG: ABC transporter permease [Acidimicrobiia bacterium]|nr:ABC transporter permease [Acidimicrobiia bacterium]